ncbi:hypothetical protein [Nonlabens sp.]|uniref:hypothetical protein n=1 Tax=Nonlabens sp. TaxID=1888209 RepID=UPI001BCC6622|nr:hypothetical protein [Nonlabens sp.]
MKFKWYIGALIAIASYFVVVQQRNDLPNQEIVVTFSHTNSDVQLEKAVAFIRTQLLGIGAENVTVAEVVPGSLKVTYYSDLELQSVTDHLFIASHINDVTTSLRLKENSSDAPLDSSLLEYQIDIYEISDDLVSGMHPDGKSYLELKQDYHRGSQVHFYTLQTLPTHHDNHMVTVAQKVSDQVLLTFNTSSFNIPEVRAGPLS